MFDRWVNRGPPNYPFVINRDSPQAKGLVNWWTGDRLFGNIAKKSVTLNAGFLATAPKHILIPGATSEVSPELGDIDSVGTTSWTMHSVIKIINLPIADFGNIFGRMNDVPGVTGWTAAQFIFSTGAYGFGIGSGAATFNLNITTLNEKQVYYLTTTYDGANLKYYVDGVFISQQAATLTPQNTSNPWKLGWGFRNNRLNYEFYEGRIYNRPLSASEVYGLYAPQTRGELFQPMQRPQLAFVSVSPVVPSGPTLLGGLYNVPAEDRVYVVPNDGERIYNVPAEDRIYVVPQ